MTTPQNASSSSLNQTKSKNHFPSSPRTTEKIPPKWLNFFAPLGLVYPLLYTSQLTHLKMYEKIGLRITNSLVGTETPQNQSDSSTNNQSTKLIITVPHILKNHPSIYYEAKRKGIPIMHANYLNQCIIKETILNIHQTDADFQLIDMVFTTILDGMHFMISPLDFRDEQEAQFLKDFIEANSGTVVPYTSPQESNITTRGATHAPALQKVQYFIAVYDRTPSNVSPSHKVTVEFLDDKILHNFKGMTPTKATHFPLKSEEPMPTNPAYQNVRFGIMLEKDEDLFDAYKIMQHFGLHIQIIDPKSLHNDEESLSVTAVIVDPQEWKKLSLDVRKKFNHIKFIDKTWLFNSLEQQKLLQSRDYIVRTTAIKKRKRRTPSLQASPSPSMSASLDDSSHPAPQLKRQRRIQSTGENGTTTSSDSTPQTLLYFTPYLFKKYEHLRPVLEKSMNTVIDSDVLSITEDHIVISDRFVPRSTILVALSRGSLICSEQYLISSKNAMKWQDPKQFIMNDVTNKVMEVGVVDYWHQRVRKDLVPSPHCRMVIISLEGLITIPQKRIIDSTMLLCGAAVVTSKGASARDILKECSDDASSLDFYVAVSFSPQQVSKQDEAALKLICNGFSEAGVEVKVVHYEYFIDILVKPNSTVEDDYRVNL